MDIKTLESLGISAEALGDRIVDQAVEELLVATGYDPDDDREVSYESRFKKEIEKRVQAAVDEKIAALAAVHLVPRVGELIEQADMRETTRFGEPKSAPLTFKEYIAHRADTYMREEVDYFGNSKADLCAKGKSDYNWRPYGPRLTVLMKMYIRDTLEKTAKNAVTDVNKVIAQNIESAAKEAIASAAASLKVSVATK